ncbi:hypothetical protein D9C73_002269 [Collichthys lucidus]|uniref:Uncharacterized protein n=1 Tax=Collichthys lucidus TaxID=240159 RepID=A0A4U5U3A9_COLLU|nr:hypothetical protein D9C73_002269 [Collichthys lucidus]
MDRNKLQTEKQQRARPSVLPPLLSRGGATQAANQKLNAETPAPLSPEVGQPQPGVPQQPAPQGGPQFLPPTQYYVWSTLGGSPMIMPLQPHVHGSLPTFPQQPLLSPYGFQMIPPPPLLQTPANQPPNSLVLPAETPSGVAPSGNALNPPPQPFQQQQMAATMGQLGVYLPRVLTNPSTVAVQPVNQANGLTNPEQQGTVQTVNQAAGLANRVQQDIVPTVGAASAGVQQTSGLASSGPQLNTNAIPKHTEALCRDKLLKESLNNNNPDHVPTAGQRFPAAVFAINIWHTLPNPEGMMMMMMTMTKQTTVSRTCTRLCTDRQSDSVEDTIDRHHLLHRHPSSSPVVFPSQKSFFHYLPHYAGSRTQGPSQIYPHRFPGAGGSNPAQPFPSHGFIKYSIPQPPGRQSVEVIPSFDANPIPSQDPLQPLQQDQPAQTSQVPPKV